MLSKLLKAGTVVEANLEHARYSGGFAVGPIIEAVQDCAGNCERRDDGNYDYLINAPAVISRAHLKKVRKGTAPANHLVIQLGPEQVAAVDEWRRQYAGDLLPLELAVVRLVKRLVKWGLETAAKRKEETLLALLTRVYRELEDRLEGSPGGKPPPYMAHLGGAITEVERAIAAVLASSGATK
jgi:hypothetical protein